MVGRIGRWGGGLFGWGCLDGSRTSEITAPGDSSRVGYTSISTSFPSIEPRGLPLPPTHEASSSVDIGTKTWLFLVLVEGFVIFFIGLVPLTIVFLSVSGSVSASASFRGLRLRLRRRRGGRRRRWLIFLLPLLLHLYRTRARYYSLSLHFLLRQGTLVTWPHHLMAGPKSE